MKTLDFLGLNEQKVNNVIEGLAQLLADFQVFYTNLRGFHWTVKGRHFFIMHAKYEELYDDVAEKVDELAERLLQLGAVPESKFSEYLKVSAVKEAAPMECEREVTANLLDTFKLLIRQEREVLSAASEVGDEVTVSLMSDYLKGQEKTVWMLVAFSAKHRHEE